MKNPILIFFFYIIYLKKNSQKQWNYVVKKQLKNLRLKRYKYDLYFCNDILLNV